jgi:hypothetical protein
MRAAHHLVPRPRKVPSGVPPSQRFGLLASIYHMRQGRPYLWNHRARECQSALWIWGYADDLIPGAEIEQALSFANVPVRGVA